MADVVWAKTNWLNTMSQPHNS